MSSYFRNRFYILEASCPNVGQELGAKHSTLSNVSISSFLVFWGALFFKKNISATIPLSSGENIIIWIQILLEAGGKPSTWFPPGILVELIEANELFHWTLTSYKSIFSIFNGIDFWIFENYFSTYQFFDTRNRYYLIRRILHVIFDIF